MREILKSFTFEAEKVELKLNIYKEFHKSYLRIIIDGELTTNNDDIKIGQSTDITTLSYLGNNIFWMSFNGWKGLRWANYSNQTKYSNFRNVKEMREAYITQRDFIPLISEYFYDCIKKYKKIKVLYETNIGEIMSSDEL